MKSDTKYPTIGIVTPSFNQGVYIEETIKSVLTQKGNFYIDYVIADGGSTDNSIDIIKKYQKMLNDGTFKIFCKGINLEWWSRSDNGQSDAINQGFLAVNGLYTAWINSDDLYEPNAFEHAIKLLGSNKELGLVYSNYIEIDSAGKQIRKLKTTPFSLKLEINSGNLIPQPASFMRKSTLLKAGLLNEKYHYAMDYDLWIRVGQISKVIHADEYWAKFRLHENSKTVSLEKKFWPEVREISRKYGGSYFSQLYINHHHNNHPKIVESIQQLNRGIKILKQAQFKKFFSKIAINIKRIVN